MIKDTFFSMPRFVNLCRKDMVESWRTNLLRLLLLYGVMVVVVLWVGYLKYNQMTVEFEKDPLWDFSFGLFLWALLGFGCLSASFTMEKMKSKTSRLSMLMIPATPFEKYFSRWMFSTVIFFVVFLIVFELVDYTRVLVYSQVYPELESISAFPLFSAEEFTLTVAKVIIAFCFFAQSCFVLGSTIWPKNAFLKTFVAGAIIAIVYSLLAAWMGDLFYDEKTRSIARDLGRDTKFAYGSIILYAFTLFNWVFGYFRFKESEIINRM